MLLAHVGRGNSRNDVGARMAGCAPGTVPAARAPVSAAAPAGRAWTEADPITTRFERTLADHATPDETLPAVLAEAARTARSRLDAPTIGERVVRDVAAGIGGPVLVGFAAWMLRTARDAGVRRLYFLARDGQVLHQVARILAPRFGWDPAELRYLYVSRQAINTPLLWEAGETASPWMWPVSDTATAEDHVGRSGLPAGPVDAWLRAAGIDDVRQPLTPTQRRRLVASFAEGAFGPEGRSRLEQQRTLVYEHLVEEGFLDDLPVATVDSGGHGSQLQALAYARRAAGRSLPWGYCLQLLRGARTPIFEQREFGWLEDGWRGIRVPAAANLTVLLETLCAADHGSVHGYRRASDRIVPVLGPPPSSPVWDRGMLRRAVEQVAIEAAAAPSLPPAGAATREAVLHSIDDFWERPTRLEVAVWRRSPIDATTPEAGTLAKPVSLRRALRYRLGLGWSGDWRQWPEGCIRISRPTTRLVASRPVTAFARLVLRRLRRGRAEPGSSPPHTS